MFEIRTIADAKQEAVQPSQVSNSAALRVAARNAAQAAQWRTVRVLAGCMALLALLLCGAPRAQAQVVVGGVQSQIAPSTWTGPVGVATDSSGNIYVASYTLGPIMKIDATTKAVTTFFVTDGTDALTESPGDPRPPSSPLYRDQGIDPGRLLDSATRLTCTYTAQLRSIRSASPLP